MIDLFPAFENAHGRNSFPKPTTVEKETITRAAARFAEIFAKAGVKVKTCLIPGTDFPKLAIVADDVDRLRKIAEQYSFADPYECNYNSREKPSDVVHTLLRMVTNMRLADLPIDRADVPTELNGYEEALVSKTPPLTTLQLLERLSFQPA